MAPDAFIGLPEPFNSMIVFRNIGFYLHGALWKVPEGQDISLSLEWKSRGEIMYRRAHRKTDKWSTEEHGAYEPCSGLATISVNGIEIPRKMDIACMWDEEVAP